MKADHRRRFPRAARIVLSLWAPYVVLNTIYPGPALTYGLSLLIACSALGVLWWAGLSPDGCFLRRRRLSARGALLLALLSLFLPLAYLAGLWHTFHALDALVYAPASAIAQELYFRAALLSVLLRQPGGERRAVPLQALLFSLWHARAFRLTSPPVAAAVLAVVFFGGLLWGCQVARDRTVCYAIVQHTLFLAVQ
jgi:hypothetical protein